MNDLLHGFGLPPLHDPDALIASTPNLTPATRIDAIVSHPTVALRNAPDNTAEAVSELLFGEPVQLLEPKGDWHKVISIIDAYTGWVPAVAVQPHSQPPTHRVTAPFTHRYTDPSLKSAPTGALPQGAFLTMTGQQVKRFAETDTGDWVFAEHLRKTGTNVHTDPLVPAEAFLGTPYLWGGRSRQGIDCSGLVQVSLAACGFRVVRDTGPQLKTLGRPLAEAEPPMRGDLAFFPGHVGFMIDQLHLLHANATHMMVTIDPLADVIRWVTDDLNQRGVSADAFSGFRRLS